MIFTFWWKPYFQPPQLSKKWASLEQGEYIVMKFNFGCCICIISFAVKACVWTSLGTILAHKAWIIAKIKQIDFILLFLLEVSDLRMTNKDISEWFSKNVTSQQILTSAVPSILQMRTRLIFHWLMKLILKLIGEKLEELRF